jgi:hypothetical protein
MKLSNVKMAMQIDENDNREVFKQNCHHDIVENSLMNEEYNPGME